LEVEGNVYNADGFIREYVNIYAFLHAIKADENYYTNIIRASRSDSMKYKKYKEEKSTNDLPSVYISFREKYYK
jgi:ribosome-interacting GTPase 1